MQSTLSTRHVADIPICRAVGNYSLLLVDAGDSPTSGSHVNLALRMVPPLFRTSVMVGPALRLHNFNLC